MMTQTTTVAGVQAGEVTPEPSARERAVARLEQLDDKAAEWQRRKAAAESELASLKASARRDALDLDEATAERAAARMSELSRLIGMAERALEEADRQYVTARRAVLLAEAVELDEPIAEARAAVEAHEARAARLLRALEDFTGARYVERHVGDAIARNALDRGETVRLPTPKVHELHRMLERLQVAQDLLRAAAAGEDLRAAVPRAYEVDPWSGPWFRFDDLPESLRPGGLAPAPGFTAPVDEDRVEGARTALAAAERAMNAQQKEVDAIVASRDSEDYAARWHWERSDLRLEQQRLADAKSRFYTAEATLQREQQAASQRASA